ncbi:MAG: alpha/beta fold hydrolase [Gemmatimonadaceae bacterium]
MPDAIVDADLLRIAAGPGAMHVERYGQGGEAVVLLHGFGTSSFLWRGVAPALAAEGYTAYAIDLLGYGESDRPLEADYSIAAQTEYLERALGVLRLQRVTLVGIDIGGGIALRLALSHETRVSRLVLINTVAFEECPGSDVRALLRGTVRFAFRVSRGVLGAAPLLREVLEGGVASPAHMPPRLMARYLAPYVGGEGVTHLVTLARALRAEDVEVLPLSNVRVPTLVIWGEEDRYLDSGLPERVQGAIPDSRLVRLPDVARLVPEEAPETLNRLLLEFMRIRTVGTASESC